MNSSFLFLEILQTGVPGFWQGLWGTFIQGALATVLVSFLSWLAVRVIGGIRQLVKARGRYRIAGVWVGKCQLPRYGPGVEAIEVYRLVTKKEHVTMTFYNYLLKNNEVQKYEGAGIYRGITLSAFYYISEAQSSESGVLVLQKFGEEFIGRYAQYDLKAQMKFHEGEFVLTRVQRLPLRSQLKMMWGFRPVHCYGQAKDIYENTVKPPEESS